jgi:choline dehydrogenase-like flavoprotein
VLDKWHQLHACKNVFVTDGACMTSTSTQNPSLTYMAFLQEQPIMQLMN